MSWFWKRIDRAIESGIAEGARKAVPSICDTVLDSLWNHRAYPVIAGGQLRLMREGIEPRKAWELSRQCLHEFLKSERVEVGHPDYDWSDKGGATLVEEMEIEHWEARAS